LFDAFENVEKECPKAEKQLRFLEIWKLHGLFSRGGQNFPNKQFA